MQQQQRMRITKIEVEVGATENLGNYDNAKITLRAAADVDVAVQYLPDVIKELALELQIEVDEFCDRALERTGRPARHDRVSPRYAVLATSTHSPWVPRGKVAPSPLAPAVAVVPFGLKEPEGWVRVEGERKGLRRNHAFEEAYKRQRHYYDDNPDLQEVGFYDLTAALDLSALPVRGPITDAPAPSQAEEIPSEQDIDDDREYLFLNERDAERLDQTALERGYEALNLPETEPLASVEVEFLDGNGSFYHYRARHTSGASVEVYLDDTALERDEP